MLADPGIAAKSKTVAVYLFSRSASASYWKPVLYTFARFPSQLQNLIYSALCLNIQGLNSLSGSVNIKPSLI